MKHARPDYQRIQDPLGIIPNDLPVFLLMGKDLAAPPTLRFWCDRATELGAAPEFVQLVRDQADAMEQWQDQHGGKVPDMPPAHELMATDSKAMELQSIRRAAVLVVAALAFPRMAADTAAGNQSNAAKAFDAAEAFVRQAETLGYDPATIMLLAEGLGAR